MHRIVNRSIHVACEWYVHLECMYILYIYVYYCYSCMYRCLQKCSGYAYQSNGTGAGTTQGNSVGAS